MRLLLGWLIYPALMAATVGSTVLLYKAHLPAVAVVALVTSGAAVLIIALERVLPYRREWLRSHGDLRVDLSHLIFSGALAEAGRAGILAGLTLGAIALSRAIGTTVWPNAWPLWVQVPLALVIAELGAYWAHRAMHETGLFRIHAVHHSAPRLYWLNGMRLHPLDTVWSGLSMAPLVLLGAGDRMLVVFATFAGVHMMMQHANLDTRLGPLNWIFSMNEVHRWHHSRVIAEQNGNYGGVLLLWDVVFGTRFYPTDRTPPVDVGLAGLRDFPTGYVAQLASPFRSALWRRGRDVPVGSRTDR